MAEGATTPSRDEGDSLSGILSLDPPRRRKAVDGLAHVGEPRSDALVVEVAHHYGHPQAHRELQGQLGGHKPSADDADRCNGPGEARIWRAERSLGLRHGRKRMDTRAELIGHDELGQRVVFGGERGVAFGVRAEREDVEGTIGRRARSEDGRVEHLPCVGKHLVP